ncbi:transmembrane and immunoglobulin domain-containing protein 1 [Anomaloglossus baeobatrachus]|uniref:transmembrane and immunoglobulin domain-containing protein 1 n=1 Tax=Anomaloglossus baeobatrachus TaxID=238106 RepID=UPI003F502A92
MKNYLIVLAALLPLLPQVTGLHLLLNNVTYDNRHTANLNDPVNLRCEVVDNINDASLIWYRGTQQVDIKSENSVNVSNICIPELTIEDNGVSFTCLLKQNTSMKLSLQMDVRFPPILTGETKIMAEEGKTVQITCGFQANPAAAIFWRQNNGLFTLPSRYKQDMTTDTLQLTIDKATKQDSANYTCVALSQGNETIRVIQLIVGDRQPGLPVGAIAAAVVVGALIIAFGMFARRDKVFRACKKSQNETAM